MHDYEYVTSICDMKRNLKTTPQSKQIIKIFFKSYSKCFFTLQKCGISYLILIIWVLTDSLFIVRLILAVLQSKTKTVIFFIKTFFLVSHVYHLPVFKYFHIFKFYKISSNRSYFQFKSSKVSHGDPVKRWKVRLPTKGFYEVLETTGKYTFHYIILFVYPYAHVGN